MSSSQNFVNWVELSQSFINDIDTPAIVYNSDTGAFQYYEDGQWNQLSGGVVNQSYMQCYLNTNQTISSGSYVQIGVNNWTGGISNQCSISKTDGTIVVGEAGVYQVNLNLVFNSSTPAVLSIQSLIEIAGGATYASNNLTQDFSALGSSASSNINLSCLIPCSAGTKISAYIKYTSSTGTTFVLPAGNVNQISLSRVG